MQLSYIISQLLVMIAYIFMGIGFLKKDKISILLHSEVYNLFMLLQYVILNGLMGIVVCIMNIVRNIIFIYNEKRLKQNNISLLFIFSFFSILSTIIFYKSPFDIVPCILAILGLYAYWCPSTKILRLINIVCSFCYILYAIPLKSYATILCEIYLLVNILIGFFKHEKREHD